MMVWWVVVVIVYMVVVLVMTPNTHPIMSPDQFTMQVW